MSYTATKWNKFKFILHPKEFEHIFQNLEFFIVVTNQRVEVDYEITDRTSIFEQYERFYTKIISGDKWKNKDRKLEIYTQITNNRKHISYELFEIEEDNQLKKFKRAIQIEPVINISPFSLMVDERKQQLRVNIFDHKGNSQIGLELTYPKEILQNHSIIQTQQLSTYKLYTELIRRIKKHARKVKAVRNNLHSVPDFWISEKCLTEINNNFGLKDSSIVLA